MSKHVITTPFEDRMHVILLIREMLLSYLYSNYESAFASSAKQS